MAQPPVGKQWTSVTQQVAAARSTPMPSGWCATPWGRASASRSSLRAGEGAALPGAGALVVHHQRRRHLRDADAGPRRRPDRQPGRGRATPSDARSQPEFAARGGADRSHRPGPSDASRRPGARLVPRPVRAFPDRARFQREGCAARAGALGRPAAPRDARRARGTVAGRRRSRSAGCWRCRSSRWCRRCCASGPSSSAPAGCAKCWRS